jgi:hypothetical protein
VCLRNPPPGCLFQSDRGSQYCSYDYQKSLQAHGPRPSMSGKGNCYDNASVETFFKSLKAELIWRHKWPTRRQAEAAIFQYALPHSQPTFPGRLWFDLCQSLKPWPSNEAPGVSLSTLDQANIYMVRGKVSAPWRLVQDRLVTSRPIDVGAQENAVQLSWNLWGSLAIEGPAIDLSKQLEEGRSLLIECPLRCFSAKGANLAAVGPPIRIHANKGLVASLRNIHVEVGN